MNARVPLFALGLLVAGCPASEQAADPAVIAAVQKSLSSRLAPVGDFRIAGLVENVGTKEQLAFAFALKQPGFMKATLGLPGQPPARSFAFDGKALSMADAGKQAERKDLTALDEESRLLALHDTFSDFTVEGWRPPLVKPRGMTATHVGELWEVRVPVDDASVKEQRITLRARDGAFVKKALVDKAGAELSATVVLEEWTDPATGLSFPKAWEKTDGSGRYRVTLAEMAVNVGATAESFALEAP